MTAVNNPAEDPELDPPAGDKTIVGTDRFDVLAGSEAEDVIESGGGNDIVFGGAGNDQIEGGDGSDKILAGDGSDTLIGGAGSDSIDGGGDSDLVLGGDGNDMVVGGDAADTIFGGAGADTLIGAAGADMLIGGSGSDVIDGGAGDDTFIIDPDQQQPGDMDILIGGGGNDDLEIFFADEAAAQAFDDLIATLGLEAALATLGLAIDGIEFVETVTPEDPGQGPSVSAPLAVTIGEDAPITAFSLLGFADDPAGGGLTAANFVEIGTGFSTGSLNQFATELVFDPQPFQFLAGGEEQDVLFGFDLVDINGESVAQTIEVRVLGANDAPIANQADPASQVTVQVGQILPGPVGQITFEEFAVGSAEPLTDGFLTVSSALGNQQVRAQGFTQIPGVFEGQFFGFAATDFFLDFQAGVSVVTFGLFDPNLLGGFVRRLMPMAMSSTNWRRMSTFLWDRPAGARRNRSPLSLQTRISGASRLRCKTAI
ncbi:MAG: calcium-binding protein [Pseudomonadota bacterium]